MSGNPSDVRALSRDGTGRVDLSPWDGRRCNESGDGPRAGHLENRMDVILIVIIVVLLFGGGFGYSRWGYGGGIGIGGVLLIILVVYLLFGHGR